MTQPSREHRELAARFRCSRARGAALLLSFTLLPGHATAQERQVTWEVHGVSGPLLDNVLASTAPVRNRPVGGTRELRGLAERAVRLSRSALEPLGYYEATSRFELSSEGERWSVVVHIEPGAPVRITRADVRLEGEGRADPALVAATARYPLDVGAILSHATYESLKAEWASVAGDRGYLDARFDSAVVVVDRVARSAAVTLSFNTGPRYALGAVRFEQDVIDPRILTDLVPWTHGDPYDAGLLVALQNEIAQGPYFSSVEIAPRRELAENGVVPVDVRLVPARPQRYSFGVGYASDTGPRGSVLAEVRRLNRAGHRAEIDARIATVEVRTAARYVVPLRFRRGSLLTLSTGYVDLHPSTSDTETWLVGANVAGLLLGWRTEVGVTLQRASYDVAGSSGVTKLFLAGVGATRVRADDRLAPTRGSLLRVRARAGDEGALSDVTVRELAVETRIVRSPIDRVRLRGRAEVAVLNTSDFDRLPGSIRYFAGGDRSVRGYGYQELGPMDAAGNVVGGSRLLVLGVEAEWRLNAMFGVATFLDAGNALTSFSDRLERGLGGGIRWLSPAGMVRLDGAFAVSQPGNPFRLHLSLGPEL